MPVPAQREVHRRTLLRDDVYVSLRDAIVRGELAPGEQLRDSELSAWLGVSRTPIREALLRLGRAGLVNATPGRITVVAPEDPQRVEWARQVASELHTLAVRMSAGRLDDEDLASMADANERLRAALEAGDAEAALSADDDFHAVLVRASGNPLIAEHLESVMMLLRRAEYLHFGRMTGSSSPRQHEAMLAALRDGDAEGAALLSQRNWGSLGQSRDRGRAADRDGGSDADRHDP